jgi:hypothetical protein
VGPAIATLGVQPNTLAAVINNAEIPLDARCLDELWREYHKAIDVGQYEIADNRLREGQHHCQLGQARECGAGEVAFGVLGRCTPACSRDKPCAQGRCVADRGRFGCITP